MALPFGCSRRLSWFLAAGCRCTPAALCLLQSLPTHHSITKALQHPGSLLHISATCRPASHFFVDSPPLRYGCFILPTGVQVCLLLAAPRRSASSTFSFGAAAAPGPSGLAGVASWWRPAKPPSAKKPSLLPASQPFFLPASGSPAIWLQYIPQRQIIATISCFLINDIFISV